MDERITVYSPNGKHGVNTLNCKVRRDSSGNIIVPKGWRLLTDDQITGLKHKTLAWSDEGVLVSYSETEEEKLLNLAQASEEKTLEKIKELLAWFKNVYDPQIKQAERCKRLGIDYDNKYGTVAELDTLAEEKAKKIRELREDLRR